MAKTAKNSGMKIYKNSQNRVQVRLDFLNILHSVVSISHEFSLLNGWIITNQRANYRANEAMHQINTINGWCIRKREKSDWTAYASVSDKDEHDWRMWWPIKIRKTGWYRSFDQVSHLELNRLVRDHSSSGHVGVCVFVNKQMMISGWSIN